MGGIEPSLDGITVSIKNERIAVMKGPGKEQFEKAMNEKAELGYELVAYAGSGGGSMWSAIMAVEVLPA